MRTENTCQLRQLAWTSWEQGATELSSAPSGREAGRLGGKQSLCGDTSQCLLGFPENLFRVQSIGFFPPPTPTNN